MNYRPEIDGLRAVAVVPVILFHAGIEIFRGGYVGVDIFFAISGYLITKIISHELEAGRFSIASFYERRARRILPALYFIIVLCAPFAWLWMLPVEFKNFSQSVIAVVLFLSNVLFWQESGYFAEAAELKPLLHTWSLAVEEQFYLLFPLLFCAVWRVGRRNAIWILLATAAASLLLCEYVRRQDPSLSFYIAPTRAWELLAGSIAAVLSRSQSHTVNNWLSALGLSIIVAAIFYSDATTPFPSLLALAPTGGAFLVLLYGGSGTLAARILSMRSFVGIGIISYSAYLWHQPLFAFARVRSIEPPSGLLMMALAAASVGLAYPTWRFIEQPFRFGPNLWLSSSKSVFIASIASGLAVLALGSFGQLTNGAAWRWDASVVAAANFKNDRGSFRADCLDGTMRGLLSDSRCALGQESRETIDFVLVGDSFAGAIADAIDGAADQASARGAILATHACPALLGLGGLRQETISQCEIIQDTMVRQVADTGAHSVLLASSWFELGTRLCLMSRVGCDNLSVSHQDFVRDTIEATILAFNGRGIRVVFVGDPPRSLVRVPETLAKLMAYDGISSISYDRSLSYPNIFHRAIESLGSPELAYVDISSYFCNRERCFVARNGVPLFFDRGHITGSVSRELQVYFAETIAET